MHVHNREKDALRTSLTLNQFGQAMAQLDLEGVPPEKRVSAIMNHLARIMSATVHDRDAALEIEASRQLHEHKRRSSLILPTKTPSEGS